MNPASEFFQEKTLHHIKVMYKDVMTDVMLKGRVLSLDSKQTLVKLPNLANKDNELHLENLTTSNLKTMGLIASLVDLHLSPGLKKTSMENRQLIVIGNIKLTTPGSYNLCYLFSENTFCNIVKGIIKLRF